MNEAWLRLTGDGKVEVQGIEQPFADIVKEQDDVIVLKVPGGKHWSGRGEQRYSGTSFQIWEFIEGKASDRSRKARRLVEFPLRQSK